MSHSVERESPARVKCDHCGSMNTIPIFYGHPNQTSMDAFLEANRRGEIKMGEGMPTYQCKDCKRDFGLLDLRKGQSSTGKLFDFCGFARSMVERKLLSSPLVFFPRKSRTKRRVIYYMGKCRHCGYAEQVKLHRPDCVVYKPRKRSLRQIEEDQHDLD